MIAAPGPADRYVCCAYADSPAFVLTLEPVTPAGAQRAIAWQRIGQGEFDDWRTCRVVGGRMVDEQGRDVPVHRGPYTSEAWGRFVAASGLSETIS